MKLEWDFSEFTAFANRLQDASKFAAFAKPAVKQLAKALHDMLFRLTPVKTGKLVTGWGGANYAYKIEEFNYGYRVTLKNEVPYARAVNDGHYSHNQYNAGEPTGYVVKNRTPKIYTVEGANRDSTFVYGHFFVEKAIVQTADSAQLEAIIMREFEKWWKSV